MLTGLSLHARGLSAQPARPEPQRDRDPAVTRPRGVSLESLCAMLKLGRCADICGNGH